MTKQPLTGDQVRFNYIKSYPCWGTVTRVRNTGVYVDVSYAYSPEAGWRSIPLKKYFVFFEKILEVVTPTKPDNRAEVGEYAGEWDLLC